jgi:hypothetical protein
MMVGGQFRDDVNRPPGTDLAAVDSDVWSSELRDIRFRCSRHASDLMYSQTVGAMEACTAVSQATTSQPGTERRQRVNKPRTGDM